MLRCGLGIAAVLLCVQPAAASGQGVPRPAPSPLWSTATPAPSDTARVDGVGSMPAAGAIFGGLLGLAIGLSTCHSCDSSGRPMRGLVGAVMGMAIGFTLGSLFETF
jgi:hypothetical protein